MSEIPPLSDGTFSPASFPPSPGDSQLGQLAPELGGALRSQGDRTGLEPELGSGLRQRGVYVDEVTCIGCRHCAHVARNTFYIEPDYGRARVVRQDGDSEALIQEAIDTCPVDCISWLDYKALREQEAARKYQVIPTAGFPVEKGMLAARSRKRAVDVQQQRRRGN